MNYKRFLFIAHCLQFNDQSTTADRHKFDKLSAICLFLNYFSNNSRVSYNNMIKFTTVDQTSKPWYFINED